MYKRTYVRGYEGLYEIDTDGVVYSLSRKCSLKPHNKNGYLAVNLFKNGTYKHFYVHRLIAEEFIPNPNNWSEVNHKNCDKFDNRVENLEWCTRKQNLQHSYDNGLKRVGEKHGCHKLTCSQVKEIRQSNGLSQSELAKKYNVKQCTISAILTNKIWKKEVI